MLNIAAPNDATGRRDTHVAGSASHVRYAEVSRALLPDLGVETTHDTAGILG